MSNERQAIEYPSIDPAHGRRKKRADGQALPRIQRIPSMPAVDIQRVERKRRAAERSRSSPSMHSYFAGVAKARFVIRKAFRIVEEQAKALGIDPLDHQALIQIYGSPSSRLQVNQIAEKLDIAPAFASSLVSTLVKGGLALRQRDKADQRVTFVSVTAAGENLLYEIDEQVRFHVEYFTRQLTQDEREHALSILLFYVGATIAER
jgi:DNA-binding MarR family transcriptional regulator